MDGGKLKKYRNKRRVLTSVLYDWEKEFDELNPWPNGLPGFLGVD